MVLPEKKRDGRESSTGIVAAARTGQIGDGKIFLSRIDESIRFATMSVAKGAL